MEPRAGDRNPPLGSWRRGAGIASPAPGWHHRANTAIVVEIVRSSAHELADHHGVTGLPSNVRRASAEAGELLGLSRRYVVRLLDQEEIHGLRRQGVEREG